MNRMKKHKTSISVSEEGERLLRLLAEKLAINRSAVVEVALRAMAKAQGIK